MPTYTRAVVLASSPEMAHQLALHTHLYTPTTDPKAVQGPGAFVVGVRGLHGYSVAAFLAGGQQTLLVGWALHPNDHALSFVRLEIADTSPITVERQLRNAFWPYKPGVTQIVASNLWKRNAATLIATRPAHISSGNPPVRPGPTATLGDATPPQNPSRDAMIMLVRDMAIDAEINPSLALAIVHVESGFDPHAVSLAGAKGLMQLMPSTAKQMGVTDPFDPVQNVKGGLGYLKLLSHYDADPLRLLSMYHSGRGAVQQRGISEADRIYVKRVHDAQLHYVDYLQAQSAT